ncbi:MAG: hypothetical protein [Bacteriophage sp.]|nr:MAG: hypothetical protein [Bacteriophage sp.]
MQKKIVFANLDTQFLTMYSESGEEIIIAQGDPRIRKIVEAVFPAIDSKGYYILSDEDLSEANNYHEAEKSLGGVVKFFRMAKAKLAEIVDKFTVDLSPKAAGTKPVPFSPTPLPASRGAKKPIAENIHTDSSNEPLVQAPPAGMSVQSEPTGEAKPVPEPKGNAPLNSALAEIMENATPVGSPEFHTQGATTEEQTIVAVVDGGQVVTGIEKIEHQLSSIAQKLGSAEGVTNFFRRLAGVERGHSVEDLLTFMQKGELPIADDGTVLVYKLLNSHGQGDSLYFTDVHSGNVKQKIGSKVFMSEDLVDPNRNKDCSNGLHIARRDYLRSFSGNACMLCKLAPEDVIAVPHSDARKLRAKGYFIVAQLSNEDRNRVKNNQPMQDKVLLGNVAAGNHTEVLELVEITKGNGGGLIVTPLHKPKTEIVLDQTKKSSSLDELEERKEVVVDARAVALGIKDPATEAAAEPLINSVIPEPVRESAVVPSSGARPIDILVRAFTDENQNLLSKVAAAKALLDFKKAAKKSWTALGVKIEVWEKATQLVVDSQAPVAPLEKPAAPVAEKPAVNQVQKPTMSRIQQLVIDFSDAKSGSRTEYYAALAVIKYGKDSKKSLEKLGVPTAVITKVQKVATKGEPAQQPVVKALAPKKVRAKVKPVTVKAEKVKPIVDPSKAKLTQAERAAELWDAFVKSPTAANAQAMADFKKSAKKGWLVLGLPADAGDRVATRLK